MSRRANYFKIGMFVIVAVSIGIATLLYLGGSLVLRTTIPIETYFDESVGSLEVGAPIKYRGVKIGSVAEIDFVRKVYRDQMPAESPMDYVYVRASIRPEVLALDMSSDLEEMLAKAIEKGLRVRLVSSGITGVTYLEADYAEPERFPPLPMAWEPDHLYVPSGESIIARLTEGVDAVVQQLSSMHLDQLGSRLASILERIDQGLEQSDLPGAAQQVDGLVVDLRSALQQADIPRLSRDLDGLVQRIDENLQRSDIPGLRQDVGAFLAELSATNRGLQELVGKAVTTVDELQGTTADLHDAVSGMDRMVRSREQDLDLTLQHLRRSSEYLDELLSQARKHPSALLFGAPPPRLELKRP